MGIEHVAVKELISKVLGSGTTEVNLNDFVYSANDI